ncbi:NAD-dependent epimerase/dehydratase family protein [Phytoactinopolyspora limicola]|uniref:NAD-dependent epimerase/dehydratase family protein n=1 Tax=Phytoactinopolyspora limicola TaxID=2715536 RepID=UPI001407B155|nr:NAD(P)-dependent oxidoreductase [Phytoactinopolyspora limicola]
MNDHPVNGEHRRKRVLIVGGSGRVGQLVTPALAEHHDLRLLDLTVPPEPALGEFIRGSVTDFPTVRGAAQGHDALVYLAMGRHDGWNASAEWEVSHFDVNVTGLHLTLQAAAEAGVRHVVYSSSGSVFADYKNVDHPTHPEPDAYEVYGLTKRLGEEVCAAAARRHGISVIALRLVGPMSDDEWRASDGPHRDVVTSGSDVANAYLAALKHPRPGFRAYVVSGDVDRRIIDWSVTHRDLGWRPLARRH